MNKLPWLLLLLLATVVARSNAASTTTELSTYWRSKLKGALMPPSIKNYLPAQGKKKISSQFVTSNSSLLLVDVINISKCQRPPDGIIEKEDKALTSLHFLEKDLSKTSNLVLYPKFPNLNSLNGHFIPRRAIENLPSLKSTNLPNILARYSISSNSTASKVIKHTIELCEFASKDDNTCITSLESMIDYVKSTVGKSTKEHTIQAFSTTMEAKYFTPSSNSQPYRIVQVKRLSNLKDSTVSCHKAEFPFAVFLCHQRQTTLPYMVTLEGMHDKTMIEAATVCHIDTSEWDPNFPGLVALKATPGTPVCHFLNQGSVLWVGK